MLSVQASVKYFFFLKLNISTEKFRIRFTMLTRLQSKDSGNVDKDLLFLSQAGFSFCLFHVFYINLKVNIVSYLK